MSDTKNKFQILNEREWILKRPQVMIGSIDILPIEHFIDGQKRQDDISQALLKILQEIVDNGVDEHIRSEGKAATKIEVFMTKDHFRVKDNGRGIPSDLIEDKYRAEWAWCFPRSGTSFNEIQTGPSANGIGSYLTNVFSRRFTGCSADGKLKVIVEAKDNLNSYHVNALKCKPTDKYTDVLFEPDFERFGLSEFSQIYFDRVLERLKLLSIAYPKIKFYYNGENVSIPFKKYIENFSENRLIFSGDNYQYAFFTHDYEDFTQLTTVNGLELFQGGTLTNFFYRNVFSIVSTLLKKKNKVDVSVNEIKKSIGFVFIGSEFPNPKFTSQNKEALSNPDTELKAYLGKIDYDKIAKVIHKSPLVELIIENWNAKKELEAFKEVEKNNKKSGKVKSKKYTPASGNDILNKVLFLTEGKSAAGQIKNKRDIKLHGVYELRGKMLNIFGLKPHEIIKNEECRTLISILGLTFDSIYHAKAEDGTEVYFKERDLVKVKISNKVECRNSYSFETLSAYFKSLLSGKIVSGYKPGVYGSIAMAADDDEDGKHVSGLAYNVLFFWPELFIQKRVKRASFYLVRLTTKQGKIEYTNDVKDVRIKQSKEVDYLKGLGSLQAKEINSLVYNEYDTWEIILIDDTKPFDTMFNGQSIQARKDALME